MNDHRTVIDWTFEKFLADPDQIIFDLFGQLHPGPNTGMTEEIIA